VSSRKFKTVETSEVSSLVHSLKRRSGDELGAGASSKLLNHTHDSVLDWIRSQRMSLLPPEGSSYDKVLSWAQLFVERLHSFDEAIEEFAGDSYLAARLAYGYCALLLEVQPCILLKRPHDDADTLAARTGKRVCADDFLWLLLQHFDEAWQST
jgi:hypothetical protein